MPITIPDFGLVVLIGAAGSGKTSFADRHFRQSEILSSDHYREVVGDDDRNPRTTSDAFEVMASIAAKRLAARRVAVIDATNVHPDDRAQWVQVARAHHAPLTAVVLDVSEGTCHRQNGQRGIHARPRHVVHRQWNTLRRSKNGLQEEGYRRRHRLRSAEEILDTEVQRAPLKSDRRDHGGPFDIIGDVHGCQNELAQLLKQLGYTFVGSEPGNREVRHPGGRIAVFTGDLTDRGPDPTGVLSLVMDMADKGQAMVVQGNHEAKLARALGGADVERKHGLATTMEALEQETPAFRQRVRQLLTTAKQHYMLNGGRLVVAHAGMKEELQGRSSAEVRSFGLYGETTGEVDEEGMPVRKDWALEYRGEAAVVYGHTPVAEAVWRNNTMCVDTGCVYGGALTALRWPEREVVSVAAEKPYDEPSPASMTKTEEPVDDRMIDIADVSARQIQTRLGGKVGIRKENRAAALEIMSRHAVDPRWLIYLPPRWRRARRAARTGSWSTRPRRSSTTRNRESGRSCARRSTWARGQSP